MLIKCEKEIDINSLIKDLDIKSKKSPIDPKNSYIVAVNRELLANARDVLRQFYEVVKDKYNQWFIVCYIGNTIGLTWRDGKTLNGKEEEFYIGE